MTEFLVAVGVCTVCILSLLGMKKLLYFILYLASLKSIEPRVESLEANMRRARQDSDKNYNLEFQLHQLQAQVRAIEMRLGEKKGKK